MSSVHLQYTPADLLRLISNWGLSWREGYRGSAHPAGVSGCIGRSSEPAGGGGGGSRNGSGAGTGAGQPFLHGPHITAPGVSCSVSDHKPTTSSHSLFSVLWQNTRYGSHDSLQGPLGAADTAVYLSVSSEGYRSEMRRLRRQGSAARSRGEAPI